MTLPNPENERFFLQLIAEGKLQVTLEGKAFNLITKQEIGTSSKTNVYLGLCWKDPTTKRRYQILLHRLIWTYFKGPINPTLQINHKDGNKSNNHIKNLEICTPQENQRHSYKILNKHSKKFTEAEVLRYRKLFKEGTITKAEISNLKNCGEDAVRQLIRGDTYKHLL